MAPFFEETQMEMSEKRNDPGITNAAQKGKAIELAVQAIEKQFGKGSIMRLGNAEMLSQDVAAVPTGSLSLDIALGIGGYPRGRIVEIYGPEASGKTTLTLHAIAEVQKQGGIAAFVDAEHALDVTYARKLGVRTDDLLISQPDTGEQALEIADMLVRSGGIDLLVVDSVAALVPRAEIEGEMGDAHMGLQARLMSQALRKLTGTISRSKTLVIFINQIRMKIGVMFGNPETTTGGNALKFYSSVRLDIRRIQALKDGETVIGNRTRVKVVKNKMAPPFREVEFDIIYGEGISREGDLLDLAANHNVIEKSGTWYTYRDERIGQGRENARNYLKEHPEMVAKVREEVLAKTGVKVIVSPPSAVLTAAQNVGTNGAAPAAPATGATASGPAKPVMNAAPVAKPATATSSALAAAEAAAARASKPAAAGPNKHAPARK
jgi:recombination protein RecA